ncbi:MAG: type pilus assembly protein PilA [Candidatus Sumerlaeota bacterium]|nr:type pilus assembly protein PilA [Candidatus Sumerlaeota bacterium]
MTQSRIKTIRTGQGFTLIELLIVVAIIAILAAIAVPNFLEAQVRSKVSRSLSDMRTIRTALESYAVDNNKYPETDLGRAAYNAGYRTIDRLTTPISYITSIPKSPFIEKFGASNATDPKMATLRNHVLYVRKDRARSTDSENPTGSGVDANYYSDRIAYLQPPLSASIPVLNGIGTAGQWLMKSNGPNNFDDREAPPVGFGTSGRVYDPTNGTASDGDIVVFSDLSGTGKNI